MPIFLLLCQIMKIHFYKYQGAGNDFIVVDGRTCARELSQQEINLLCDRRFGIGADGLMVVENASEVDFTMRYYNADGKEGSMCGNGGRCIVAYVAAGNNRNHWVFSAVDGVHHATVMERGRESQICLGMNDVDKIDFYGDGLFFLNTGSPHLVLFERDIDLLDVSEKGAFWRHHPDFLPEGTNVNFAEMMPDGTLFVRTFERGVERETLACGTGVTAAAIAAYVGSIDKDMGRPKGVHTYHIRTLGGPLQVTFKTKGIHFYDVQLTGSATFVFEGDLEYD